MASPITYKRLVLSGDKAKETADEVKAKMAKDWKRDFPDGKLDIKSGVEGKMVIDVTTKDSSAASLASKIKDIATRNKVTTITKDKPTLKAVKENQDDLIKKIKSSLTYQVTGGKKGEPMSANEKLPANTKITKAELKEMIKEEAKTISKSTQITLSGSKIKETIDQIKEKLNSDWKTDFRDVILKVQDDIAGRKILKITTRTTDADKVVKKFKELAKINKTTVEEPKSSTSSSNSKDKPSSSSSSEKIKKDPKDMTDDELKSSLKFFKKKKDNDDDDFDKSTVAKLFKTVGATIDSATDIGENKITKSELKEIIKNFNK